MQRDMTGQKSDKFKLEHSLDMQDSFSIAFTRDYKAAWPLVRPMGDFWTDNMTEHEVAHVWLTLWTVSVDILGFVMVSSVADATALIRCWFALGNTHLPLALAPSLASRDIDTIRSTDVFKEFSDQISILHTP